MFNRTNQQHHLTLVSVTLLLFFCFLPGLSFSQKPVNKPENLVLAQEALDKRGLTQAEAIAGLKEKGYNVEEMAPEDLIAEKDAINAILDELAANKKKTAAGGGATVEAGSEKATLMREENPDKVNTTVKEVAQETGSTAVGDIYGHAVFVNNMLGLISTTDGSRAPDHYVLGAGDRLRVTIFGASQADLLLEINESGYVQPAGLPQVYLQGVKLADARNLLRQRFSGAYRFNSDQIAVTLQTSRTITINVFGETKQQGSFSISALNSALHALAQAGGPTASGSVREIELIRGNKRRKIDLYAFMVNPSYQNELDLQHNDIIYVPIVRKLVTLEGEVPRPMRYELKAEESLADLIKFAGGILPSTYTEAVQIERFDADSLVLIEFKLADILNGKKKVSLEHGDIIRVRSSSKKLEAYLDIAGAVFYGGRYKFESNMTLQSLLDKAKLQPEAITDFYFIKRPRRDNSVEIIRVENAVANSFLLQGRDNIIVFNKVSFANISKLKVEGAIRAGILELDLAFGDSISLKEALELGGGLLPEAFPTAYLIQKDLFNSEKLTYAQVDLTKIADYHLKAGDNLVVYDRKFYNLNKGISIMGAVKKPYNTTYDPSISFSGLFQMAGGMTLKSALNRVDVYRLKYDEIKGTGYERMILEVDSNYQVLNKPQPFALAPFDIVVVRELPLFDFDRVITINGAVTYPGSYPLPPKSVRLSDVVSYAGGLNALADKRYATLVRTHGGKGKVGINMDRALRRKGSNKHDPILMPGDVVFVPQFENTVGIRLRATRQADQFNAGLLPTDIRLNDVIDFVYQGPKSARWYLREFAGGFSKNADKNSVTVTYPDGKVQATRRYFGIRDYPSVKPGAVITVIEKPEKEKKERKQVDIDAMYTRTISAVTTLMTIIILSRSL